MNSYKKTIIRSTTTATAVISLVFIVCVPNRSSQVHSKSSATEKTDQKPMKLTDGANKSKQMEEIILILDKTRVVPGEKIRLTELVPNSQKGIVSIRGHHVYLISEFSQTKNVFINLEPKNYYWRSADDDFDHLTSVSAAWNVNGWQYNSINPRQKGFEYEFTARHIGVFQIIANWFVNDVGYYYSVPIILTVEPPLNDKGERIIKPEWIIKD